MPNRVLKQSLLFVGIHNAWDTVTYNVFVRRRERGEAGRPP
jgi:hypothetical protein